MKLVKTEYVPSISGMQLVSNLYISGVETGQNVLRQSDLIQVIKLVKFLYISPISGDGNGQ